MINRIFIFTTKNYLMSIIYNNTDIPKYVIKSNVDFFLIDANENEVHELYKDRTLQGIDGFVCGIGSKINQLLNTGYIVFNKDIYYPDLVIGVDSKKHPDFYNNSHGWIVVNSKNDLDKLLVIQTEIDPYEWIKNNFTNLNYVRIISLEDPYILNFEKLRYLLGVFMESEDYTQKVYIDIKCKYRLPTRNHVTNQNNRYLRELEGIAVRVFSDELFHDRRVIINGMIYIFGNSFSGKLATYVIGMSKLTYKLKLFKNKERIT